MLEVGQAALEGAHVFLGEILLVRAAVHLEGANGGDDHRHLGIQAAKPALDVEELLGAEVRAEAGLGDDDIAQRQCGARGKNGVAAVGDVAEGSGMHERGSALERLHEVGTDGVLEQERHGARCLELARAHRMTRRPRGAADNDVAAAALEIGRAGGERKDGHDFAGRHDDEPLLTRDAVHRAAESDDDLAQGAVVHVDGARPRDAARVDAERVALLQVVVEHRAQQRMGAADGVEVAGEMQVDVVHRQHLRVPAAGGTALDAEHRAERRLANGEHGIGANATQRLREAHRRGGLAFAGGRRVDGGDEHEAPLGRALGHFEGDLRLVLAVEVEVVTGQADFCRDVDDGAQRRALGDFDVGGDDDMRIVGHNWRR